jgi:hypothetical protein
VENENLNCRSYYRFALIFFLWCVFVSSVFAWGNQGHRILNRESVKDLPDAMQGFKEKDFYLSDYASEADRRAVADECEIPKHFFEIERYPEYSEGTLPRSFISLEEKYGESAVKAAGYLPYAIMATYDTLVSLMQRKDWTTVFKFTADLGHYVADAHQPFHLTSNYDGQLTRNNGIHWRYEKELVDRYGAALHVSQVTAKKIEKPAEYVFDRMGKIHALAAPILKADKSALRVAKGKYSGAYYAQFWKETRELTTTLFQDASMMFANLLYTAWLKAESPKVPTLMEDYKPQAFSSEPQYLEQNFPNPFNPVTRISYTLPGDYYVSVGIFNLFGQELLKLFTGHQSTGRYEFEFDAKNLPGGVYFLRLQYGNKTETRKMILSK